jgi:predicted metalloprotease with PDZ domain
MSYKRIMHDRQAVFKHYPKNAFMLSCEDGSSPGLSHSDSMMRKVVEIAQNLSDSGHKPDGRRQ